MRWFFRLIVLLVVLVPVAVITFLVVSIEPRPLVAEQVLMSASNVERAKRLLHEHDPRMLKPGEIKTVRVNANELNLVFNHLLNLFGSGAAITSLKEDNMSVVATLNLEKLIPNSYLNIELDASSDGRAASIERFKVGKFVFPSLIVRGLSSATVSYVGRWARLNSASEAIRVFEIQPQHVEITYAWETAIVDAVRDQFISPDDREKLKFYHQQLALIIDSRGDQITFANLVQALFDRARDRSIHGGAAAENNAVIFVLGAYVSGRKLTPLVPEGTSSIAPRRVRLTLHGRRDFVQHFATSAALAVAGGRVVADTIGLVKEINDADGGSGFSFKDLAADKAGTRFGEMAVKSDDSGARLQQRLSRDVSDAMLIPDTTGLEENLTDSEFKIRYGGLDGVKYNSVVQEIDKRLSESDLYR